MLVTWKVILLLLLTFSQAWSYQTSDSRLHINQLPMEGLLMDSGWKYKAGDNPEWASPKWEDKDWQKIDPTQDINNIPQLWNNEKGWFRLRFTLNSTLRKESLALLVEQTGASEIYLDGQLIAKYGRIGDRKTGVQGASPPFGELISLHSNDGQEQVLAVRFAVQKDISYVLFAGRPNRALALKVMEMRKVTQLIRNDIYFLDYIKASIFFILALLHLVLFINSPQKKANFYFFIFSLLSTLTNILHPLTYQYILMASTKMILLIAVFTVYTSSYLFFLLAIYSVFRHPRGYIFWLLVGLYFLNLPIFLTSYYQGWIFGLVLYPILAFLESARITLLADNRKVMGARIVNLGAIVFLILYPMHFLINFGLLPSGPNDVFLHLTWNIGVLGLPVSLSIYLATEASFISRSLEAKLVEVQQLSEKNLLQEREKRQMQKMDAVKSRFFANISHEFRTPLSLIRGTVEKLKKKDDPASHRQKDYGAIDRSAGRLLQMINQLLDLSKLESDKLTLHLQPCNLSEILRMLAGSFYSLFETKSITYRYTVPLQPVWVHLDREKLEGIIYNLLSNAAKFTPAKGHVSFTATVQVADSGSCSLNLLVEDTGIGIPSAQLSRIFERFYQVDSSATRTYEGTGIGLALVKELVDLHGGKIEVKSTEGRGSTFHLHIPFDLAEAAEISKENSVALQSKRGELKMDSHLTASKEVPEKRDLLKRNSRNAYQILVVEDNADLRQFVSDYLSESYQVKQAADGLEGYQKAVETMPDMIISDIMMPGLDGLSLCHKLKEDERTSHIPIILLTAKADVQSKMVGLQTGADDYLTKPFSAEELLLRVNNLIRQRQNMKEKYSRSLSLQPAQISVTSTDERFLQKALAIMEENMGNPDFDLDAFSREVGMSRAQLNRKLTALLDQSPNEFIRTMRLKRASQLLRQHGGNVSEVAYMVGFSNSSYFTRCFRDYYGVAPSEYLTSVKAKQETKL